MARTAIARKRTGCVTCRIRRVKCDENKPSCKRCASTGRTCDGYEAQFKAFANQTINSAHTNGIQPRPNLQSNRSAGFNAEDIEHLNHCFSTKTIFDVKLDCEEEAKQVLQASLNNPTIWQAVSSLRALREDFEASGNVTAAYSAQKTPSYNYGLQQYCMALRGLASNLSCSGSRGLKSSLLCCQIFISIEQVRESYNAMAQHVIQGLKIMREYRARPSLDGSGTFVPAHRYHEELPLLDVFLIKLYAAPCKFAERSASANLSGTTVVSPNPSDLQSTEIQSPRMIAPNMRTQLTRIAASTLEFLDSASRVNSAEDAARLLSQKSSLLDSLQTWLVSLELVDIEIDSIQRLSLTFMRLFRQIMKIILLGALDSTPECESELRSEHDQLKRIASDVNEGVRIFRSG